MDGARFTPLLHVSFDAGIPGLNFSNLLFLAFVVVPILEIVVLIQVGQVIGPWWTILLLVLDSILGAWLIAGLVLGVRTFRWRRRDDG